ncbi:cyclic lactone autoinducer peptide [Eubacterium maltosivorans]|uniref:Cyclic lactone autoinducer peptide n=1 Tax=Eubacterium maltosivorans TaxID=2041044 RepID=A0A4P9CC51_EUBML|nr:cyclic lactone autoinducer peptide [Eubacterium maltosivorans]QCT72441.1 cyclic lactone autoinducer peptide [Eubacterium maltosivorans]
MKKDGFKNKILKNVAKAAHHEAVKDANTACWMIHHQEKAPVNTKKFRKF